MYLAIERLLAPATDRIVCISEAERDSARREHVDDGKKLELIPNGIDIEAVRLAVAKKRKELGIDDRAYIVGMIGRLSPQKAPDIFIHAAKLIKEKIPEAAFIIVGNGEMTEEIVRYANDNGLQLYVTGWTDEPYAYLKMFDVALLLSRWEGFGLAIVEYMAAEKNVVATSIDAIPTLIDDGTDGLLVEVDSPEDVCDKVVWLYRHPDEAADMRKAALKKVYEKYDIQRVADQHVRMFEKLCKHLMLLYSFSNLFGGGKRLTCKYLKYRHSPASSSYGERRAAA